MNANYKNSLNKFDQYLIEVNEITDFMGTNNFWSEFECQNWLLIAVKDWNQNRFAAIEFLEWTQQVIQKIINQGFKNPQLKYGVKL